MSLITLDSVPSTNTWLKERCEEYSHGDAVTALRQTEGRGRVGHTWLDSEGMLALSMLLKSPSHVDTLTLRASIAVCCALEPLIGEQLHIKWPNDIILRGHKLCGILCESVHKCDGQNVICGIGVNISQPTEYFVQAGIPYGGSVKSLTGKQPERTALIAALTEQLICCAEKSFDEIVGEYRRRCITIGREVRIIGAQERTAFAEDISESGSLVCRDENGSFAVNSGEVSVRGLLGYV